MELTGLGHDVSIEFDVNDGVTAEAVGLARPQLVIAPFLKRAIPESVWASVPCLIVHPGVPGDRGPSALDWAILEGEREWGVTVLQAEAEMDAGPVWAWRTFPMRLAPKSSLYRREVTEAAVAATLEAVDKFERGERPVPAAELGSAARGRPRPLMKQADRAIDWSSDDTLAVLRKIHAADGFPGVRDELPGRAVHLFGAHDGTDDLVSGACQTRVRHVSDTAVIGVRDGAILRKTVDGIGLWLPVTINPP